MKIVTVGREFGSGGRELGILLADALGVPCYDKEILRKVAEKTGITADHAAYISDADVRSLQIGSYGRTLAGTGYYNDTAIRVMASQSEVIRALADRGDCVFIGRSADVILAEFGPLNLFVHAEREAKLARCMARAAAGETEREIARQMQRIDRARSANRSILTHTAWGDKSSYHLCINTTGVEIRSLVPALAAYAEAWFAGR